MRRAASGTASEPPASHCTTAPAATAERTTDTAESEHDPAPEEAKAAKTVRREGARDDNAERHSASAPTLFVSVGGSTVGCALTTYGLRKIFQYIAQRVGLEKFSPHDLRRTMANLGVQFGAPTRVVQVAGRWDKIETVEDYTQAIQQRDFDPYAPVKRLLGR